MSTTRRGRAVKLLQRSGAFIALVAAIALGAARYEEFLTTENIANVLRQNSMLGFVALGMTFVILSGGIDLSVGALVAVAGVSAAYLANHGVVIALIGGVASAALLGTVNGLLITKARIQPFITTLAMLIGARGAALAATNEQSILVPAGSEQLTWIGRGNVGVVPFPIVLLMVAYAGGMLALRYTRFGRHVYAIGDSEEAARFKQ